MKASDDPVPEPLRPLLPWAARFGKSDGAKRDAAFRRAKKSDLAELKRVLSGKHEAVDDWLYSFPTGEEPEEAYQIQNLVIFELEYLKGPGLKGELTHAVLKYEQARTPERRQRLARVVEQYRGKSYLREEVARADQLLAGVDPKRQPTPEEPGRPPLARDLKLHAAIQSRDLKAVAKLLRKGVDVDAADHKLTTPLMAAGLAGADDIAALLLERGARIDYETESGGTVVHFAALGGALRLLGHALDQGADVNARTKNGRTPLHLAANVDVARLLVERGADTSARDASPRKSMPAELAKRTGRGLVAAYLDGLTRS